MGKIDIEFITDHSQGSVRGIKQGICRHIICRPKPFALSMRQKVSAIFRCDKQGSKKKRNNPRFSPDWSEFPHELASVYPSVIQDDKSVLLYPERKAVKKVCDFIGSDIFSRTKTVITIVAINHAEYIESKKLLRRNKDIFPWELPPIRHISFRADMAFVCEVKVYEAVVCLLCEFLKLLCLIRIELRRELPLGRFLIYRQCI